MARREAARLSPHAALGATAFLHEAHLDVSRREALAFPTQAHFMAYAARAMRGLVIDRVGERQAKKTRRRSEHHIATTRFSTLKPNGTSRKLLPYFHDWICRT